MIDFPANPGPCPLQVPGVVLRPCRAEDARFLLRLYEQTREAELAAMNWPKEVRKAFCLQQFTAQHTDWTARFAGAHFLLLVSRGQPVGRLYVHVGEDDIRLIDIAVLAARQGQGIGSAVLRALQALAAERSVPLRLSVLHHNPRAQALYQRAGFHPEGRTPDRLQMVWTPKTSLPADRDPDGDGGMREDARSGREETPGQPSGGLPERVFNPAVGDC